MSDNISKVLDRLLLAGQAMDIYCERKWPSSDPCTYSDVGEWESCEGKECKGDYELRFIHNNGTPPGKLQMLLACTAQGDGFICKLFQELADSVHDLRVELKVGSK